MEAYTLENGQYEKNVYAVPDKKNKAFAKFYITVAPVSTLPGCEINLADVFAE